MATILVVDDRAENRAFLVTLLGYGGHRILEAADGAEALTRARESRPDLIVSDVLMPTMDGYEFIRALRAETEIAATQVIFTTAHYLDREATALARACGVEIILPKPSEPEAVLEAVAAALRAPGASAPRSQEDEFERQHAHLVRDKLREKTDELRAATDKMTALLELIQRTALQRDPRHLLEDFCQGARRIIGSQAAALFAAEGVNSGSHFCTSGIEPAVASAFSFHQPREGPLSVLLTHPGALRLRGHRAAIRARSACRRAIRRYARSRRHRWSRRRAPTAGSV